MGFTAMVAARCLAALFAVGIVSHAARGESEGDAVRGMVRAYEAEQDKILDDQVAALRALPTEHIYAPGSNEAMLQMLAGVAPADPDDEDPNNPPRRNSTSEDTPMDLQDLLAKARIQGGKLEK